MRAASEVRTVAVVGTGAVGSSWVALLLHLGMDVIAIDPAPAAATELRRTVHDRIADLTPDTGTTGYVEDALTVSVDMSAAADADLVLEAGPERVETKREIFAALDAVAAPNVLLASSSSGIGPSAFQDACSHPGRVLVAHPFNPPHLLPLVEVVGGKATSPEAVAAAMTTLRHWGRTPIALHAELPGHVVNRLQAALWREAYDLVGRGVVSVADLDLAVAVGPGPRWALLGPLATQHLSGGPGGLAHVLEHLGPPMVQWWDDLGAPELTPELVDTLVAGVHDEVAGHESRLLPARDRALVELLALKRRAGLLDESGTAG